MREAVDGLRNSRRLETSTILYAAALGIFMFAGCSSSSRSIYSGSSSAHQTSSTYTVQRGDNLYRIALRHNLSVSSLMEANAIYDPRQIRVGQVLLIPGGARALPASHPSIFARSSAVTGYDDDEDEHPTRIFAWPIASGVVSSGFGMRNGVRHEGVDISAPAGSAVLAGDSGTVIFAGPLRGYGETVIIRHDDHYVTVYAHNSRNLVREGDSVSRGQQIGELGATGRTTGANLHFEVRRDNIARNPLPYLPTPTENAGISFASTLGS